jgi:predicted alpha/beta hydrolase family esterase
MGVYGRLTSWVLQLSLAVDNPGAGLQVVYLIAVSLGGHTVMPIAERRRR